LLKIGEFLTPEFEKKFLVNKVHRFIEKPKMKSWTLFLCVTTIDFLVLLVMNWYSCTQRECDIKWSYKDQITDLNVLALVRTLCSFSCIYASLRWHQSPHVSPGLEPLLENPKKHEYERNQSKMKKIAAILIFQFTVNTSMGVYVAIKSLGYNYTNDSFEGAMFCVSIAMYNCVFFVTKSLIYSNTESGGVLIKALHKHKIFYRAECAPYTSCDICCTRLRGNISKEVYSCSSCDFDCCLGCFEKGDRSRGESQLRNDKGLVDFEEVSNFVYFTRAMAYARPQWALFLCGFICLMLTTFASLAIPNYQGKILDYVYKKDLPNFWNSVYLMLGFTLVTGLFSSIESACMAVAGTRLSTTVRTHLFKSIIYQDIAYFDGQSSGQLASRISSDVSTMLRPAKYVFNNVASNSISLVGAMIMCMVTSWKLSILAVTSIAPIIYVTKIYAKWSHRINAEIWQALGEGLSVVNEALANIRTIRAFSSEEHEVAKFEERSDVALRKSIKDAIFSTITSTITQYIDLGASVLILAYGGYLAIEGHMSPGKLVTFQLYWSIINRSYQSLNGVVNSLTVAAAAAERVLSLLDNLPVMDPNSGTIIHSKDIVGKIEISKLTFTYQLRPKNPVLNNIDLVIPANSTCAVVGRSGGGKSTLIHLLMRFYDLHSSEDAEDQNKGRILLDGVDLKSINLKSLHNCMGLVAQDSQLFSGTVFENITYGMDVFTTNMVTDAARSANAHEFISEFEDGYQTRVGERGIRLSGGQRQRIALARVFLRRPRLLFLDEATSALDTESEGLVQNAIDKLIQRGGCTVVVVAHRLSTVVNADKIVVLDKGCIAEEGTHEELITNDGIYKSLVNNQLQRDSNVLQQDD